METNFFFEFNAYFGSIYYSISVDLTDSSEYWDTDDTYVNFNCDAAGITSVGCITREVIVFF